MPWPLQASHCFLGGVEAVREDDDGIDARRRQLVTHCDTSWAAIGDKPPQPWAENEYARCCIHCAPAAQAQASSQLKPERAASFVLGEG